MRRALLFLCTLLLLLTGCQKREATAPISLEEEATRVVQRLGPERFTMTDADFTTINFDAEYIEQSAIYLARNGIGEWGVFLLDDPAHAKQCKALIRSYLDNERASIESLAALYPAKELQERLSLYKDATVDSEGALVWYFALSAQDRALAEQILKSSA